MNTSTQPGVVLAGICGGIAAYKCADVVSRLVRLGHEVHVSMTPAAARFVTPTTFAALTRRRVHTEMFPDPSATTGDDLFPHLYPAARADLFLLMPATADLIAKVARGLADDVVSAAALALPPETARLFCPAMNPAMWRSPVVQANVRALEDAGWVRAGPAEGEMACGTTGLGRMIEPPDIVEAATRLLARRQELAGRTVLILSGPTREPWDPVRYLGNASSGRMGQALAREALARGAAVEFVTGPVDEARLPAGARLRLHRVTRAADMLEAGRALAPAADVLIYAAAVSDFAPADYAPQKRPKSDLPAVLALKPTPDIAAELSRVRRPGQIAIGFALESENGEASARAKLQRKGLDAIVLNGVESMGADEAAFHWVPAGDAPAMAWGRLSKTACAGRILDEVAARIPVPPAPPARP